ncbi:MAG: hypothetical protein KGK08_07075 [Acidobacteriota bacterium]|nr:hypothetical protein [Acidobacteriota bacterium]
MYWLRFLWNATRGHRLRPWRSPYLRWRMETYSGRPADQLRLRDFREVMVRDRMQFVRFLRWTEELGELAHRKGPEA